MFTHPEALATMVRQHIDELVDEAARNRLAAQLRRSRRQRWPASHRTASTADHRTASTADHRTASTADHRTASTADHRAASMAESVGPAGTLALCEVRPAGAAKG
jgi:hypothetical protein